MGDKDLEKLMIKSQQGDHTAYERLLTEVSILLKPFLIKKISNSNDHDDILQIILLSYLYTFH